MTKQPTSTIYLNKKGVASFKGAHGVAWGAQEGIGRVTTDDVVKKAIEHTYWSIRDKEPLSRIKFFQLYAVSRSLDIKKISLTPKISKKLQEVQELLVGTKRKNVTMSETVAFCLQEYANFFLSLSNKEIENKAYKDGYKDGRDAGAYKVKEVLIDRLAKLKLGEKYKEVVECVRGANI